MQASKLITIGTIVFTLFGCNIEGHIRDDERAGKSSNWYLGDSDPKKMRR